MTSPERPRDSMAMALLAAFAFMIWGLYANWHHGLGSRIQVALTQGLISLLSTYFSAELIVAFVHRFRKTHSPAILGGLVSYLFIYSVVLAGHFVAGTPEFWLTVLPGMVTGLIFCLGYALRVSRKLRKP